MPEMDDEHLKRNLHLAGLLKKSFFDQLTPEAQETLDALAPGKSGTVVLWEQVDRLIKDYSNSNAKRWS